MKRRNDNHWSRSTLSFWAVWSGSTLFASRSSLIKVKVHSHPQEQSDQGLHYLPFSASDHGLHYFPFFLNSIIMVYTMCHSKQSDQDLHCMHYSAVWSESTLFVILITLMRVYTVCHAQQSEQVVHYLLSSVSTGSTICAILSSVIRVWTIWNSF